MEMEKALKKFLTAKRSLGRSAKTLEWYEYMLSDFADWLTDQGHSLEVESITPDLIEEHLVFRRAQGNKDRTVAGCYRALSAFCNFLVERKDLTVSPLAVIQRPAVVAEEPRTAHLADLSAMIAGIGIETWLDARDRMIIRLLFITGLRIAEAVALDIHDVNLPKKEIWVRKGKGGKARYVPIRPPLPADILNFLMNRPVTDERALLLSSNGDGGPRGRLTVSGVRIMLHRRAEETGTPYWNPHSYRHAAAMDMLNNGRLPIDVIAKIFGHASPEITRQVYADWTRESVQNAYNEAIGKMSDI